MADEDYVNIIREKVYGPEVLKALQNILGEQKVLSWNGFSGKNPPGVLDGTSMSFEMKLADGSIVSASGSNNFPKNYDAVRSAIASYVGDELLESNVFEGKFVKVTLPENWIGKVYVSYGDDYNAFYMKTSENDHFLLLRLDYREYEISDPEKLTRVGTLTKGDAELYFEINNYQTYLNKDKAEANEIAIYEALASTIEDISANAEAINGWTLNR